MNNLEFPIAVYALDYYPVLAFQFGLPDEYIGRSDVIIYVEYMRETIPADRVVYNVWGQFRDGTHREFLLSGSIYEQIRDEDLVQTIVCDINMQERFYQQLFDFIVHNDN